MDAWLLDGAWLRGRLILLANDCELAEAWSSATYLGRWVPRAPDDLPGSCPPSRAALAEPCDVAPPAAPCAFPPVVLLDAVSRDDLRVCFRVAELGCEAVWSNFFLRSFTLGGNAPPVDCCCLAAFPGRSSTGLDAERRPLRGAVRLAGTAGCFRAVPLLLERSEAVCRAAEGAAVDAVGGAVGGTAGAEAIGSSTGDAAFPGDCAPR